MVYLVGFAGLICGFAFGQMILHFMLRHRPKEDLLNDPSLKWKYGTLNWALAFAGAYSFIAIYRDYFAAP
jgi:ABC-type antimicrobial peptide transport system permease subunit